MGNVQQSGEAAQQHLRRIRAEKGLGDLQGPKAIIKDLEAALKVYVEHNPKNSLAASQSLTPIPGSLINSTKILITFCSN